MELRLEGKIAVVTGHTKGIGKAITDSLKSEGVKVIGFSTSEKVDLMDEGQRLYTMAYLSQNPVDILINNVGGMGRSDYFKFKECMDKNYGLSVDLTESFLSRPKLWGRVITIASIYGTNPGKNPFFTSAKAAQIMYMKSLAGKYPNITFNSVSPSEVADAGYRKDVELKSEDVANLVTFLCSDRAKFINGENIVLK